jgi:hypothetical protein
VLHQKVRIDINRSANDTTSFPVKALIKDLLHELQKASPSTMILPIDDTASDGALSMESDIPTNGEDLNKYFGGFQDAPGNSNKDIKVIRVFLRISSPMSIRDFKRNNSVFGWLKSNNFFMRTHGFSTSYDVVSAGFISRMSPTLHRRDTLNTIIQEIAQVQHPDIEIRLTPSRIPSGKGNDKRYTMAVEVQVDRKHLQTVRELMIEIFETKQDVLPHGIFFVPTPTNGSMPYELYYQSLHVHHDHIANLRSFAITNVGDLKAEMSFTDPTGTTDPRVTTFEAEILRGTTKGTTEKLFYSIEPTLYTETEGRYLLVTHKDNVAEAEQFIDFALKHLTNTCPDNMVKIMRAQTPVTRANRISTSDRFLSYVTKLQSLVPSTISMPTPTANAWKRRTPTAINITEDNFPALEPKKQRTDSPTSPETATTTDSTNNDTDMLTTIDLDEIEKAHTDIKVALREEIETLRQETKLMQAALQEQFTGAMHQLEIRIEQSTQTMCQELGATLRNAVLTMNDQATRADTLLQQFKDEASHQHDTLVRSIRNQLSGLRTKRERDTKTWDEQHHEDEDSMDEETADGSHNPIASRASHPKHGMDASTGSNK